MWLKGLQCWNHLLKLASRWLPFCVIRVEKVEEGEGKSLVTISGHNNKAKSDAGIFTFTPRINAVSWSLLLLPVYKKEAMIDTYLLDQVMVFLP